MAAVTYNDCKLCINLLPNIAKINVVCCVGSVKIQIKMQRVGVLPLYGM